MPSSSNLLWILANLSNPLTGAILPTEQMLKQSLSTLFLQSGQAAYQAEKTNITVQQVNKLK